MAIQRQGSIALTVLGGFLGSGKTTLLNHLLRSEQHERVLLMVNDFGSINIDAELLAQTARKLPAGMIELANGCACCEIGGDLMQAFLRVLSLPERPDRVLVEASGVSDPARIAAMGRAGGHFRSDGTIVVVDAETVRAQASDRYVGDTVQAQLRAADLLLINKTDLVTPAALADLRQWLQAQAPAVPMLESVQGVVDPALILGPKLSRGPADEALEPPGAQHTDHAQDFISDSFNTSRPLSRQALEAALEHLPEQVLRAKGLVFLEGEDAPRVLQLCGRRWQIGSPEAPQEPRRTRVVLIAARQPGIQSFDAQTHFASVLATDDSATQ